MILTHGSNSIKKGGGGAVIGGREYRIVTMPDGNVWLAENLDYKFSGLNVGASGTSTGLKANYYNDDEATYGIDGTRKCGLLYNWYAVSYLETNKATLCPGWHVPTTVEWDALADAVGGTGVAGTKLKALDGAVDGSWPTGWNGTDDYSFSTLPAGIYNNNFLNLGIVSVFWTATASTGDFAYRRGCNSNASMTSGDIFKYWQYSVRLVKDVI